jgi:hypothetical protein
LTDPFYSGGGNHKLKPKEREEKMQRNGNRLTKRSFRIKNNAGTQIVEFGPALVLIIVFGLLPILDLIFMGLAFSAGWYLNQAEGREAANNMPPSTGLKPPQTYRKSLGQIAVNFPAVDTLETAFLNNALFKFVGANETECALTESNTDGSFGGWGVTLVEVSSTVETRPLAPGVLKGIASIPGLNSPAVFTFYTRARQEDQGEF